MNRKLKELNEKCERLEKVNAMLERIIGYYKRDFKQLLETYKEQKEELTETRKYYDNELNNLFRLYINKIVHNKEKGTTVVWFDNKEKVIVKRRKGTKDDVYSAVAYAIAERLYGNNTRFKKVVDEGVKIKREEAN